MRTNRLLLIIVGSLGCLLVGGSCKKPLDDEKREETKAAGRREPNAALVGPDFDPVDPSVELGQVIKQLNLKTLITTDTIERLRSLLNEVARREGCDPMCVAARRAFEVDSELDQSVALGVVKLAFPDIPSKIALATQMPASRIRTSAVRHLCANELKGDLKGLRQFYEVMPVGEDRALVATEAAEVVLSDQGLSAGLDFIEKLEMPEERCSALQMANMSNTTGWKEEQNLQKFHKILDSLLPKDKKRF